MAANILYCRPPEFTVMQPEKCPTGGLQSELGKYSIRSIMKQNKNKILFLLIMVLLSGCSRQPDQISDTTSEWHFNQQSEQQSIWQDGQQSQQENDSQPSAWQSPVKIAVIDTGFSEKAIPAESIEAGRNYLYPERSTDDTYGHGTAIASIILEYAPEAILIPLVSNVYEDGKIRQVDNDVLAQMIMDAVDVYECDIINISAGLILDKEAVRDAVAYAEENNVLVVASVGNDYYENGAVKYYPAAYDTVLAVGSLTEDGTEISAFSQRGEWVDVYAVGEQVTIRTLSGNTRTSDGTSYSAAKVTAAAANCLQETGDMTSQKLRERIIEEVMD